MTAIHSIIQLTLLLTFLSVLGLGVASAKIIRKDIALVPALGLTAILGLAYVISANFKLSGANAVAISISLLALSILFRIKMISTSLAEAWRNREIPFSIGIACIPAATLLLPAILIGFTNFYGDINFDFFYNSQDSWFLQNHHVLQFTELQTAILPLGWSANFQGRFAVSLLAAFFGQQYHLDTLAFNSLLLSVLTIVFALTISVFARDFFNLNKKGILLAVLFSVMSAAFTQAYSYYLLGQISAISIVVLFFIYWKNFLTRIASHKTKYVDIIPIALILNTLYIMYAILSFFALFIGVFSYLLYYRKQLCYNAFKPLLKLFVIAGGVFCLIRLFAIPESIQILNEWITISTKVAINKGQLLILSEYLTETSLGLIFGIANFPSVHSFFNHLFSLKTAITMVGIIGFVALATTIAAFRSYARSDNGSHEAKSIWLAIFLTLIGLSSLFFFTLSSYGIFKLQTWFMPLITPLYVYIILKNKRHLLRSGLALSCGAILFFNTITSLIYLSDFVPSTTKISVNVQGINGNNDIDDLAAKLQSYSNYRISFVLSNGIEQAWIARKIRKAPLGITAHNCQPLEDKKPFESDCSQTFNQDFNKKDLLVIPNPKHNLHDIISPPKNTKILYENSSYAIVDPNQLETLAYLGRGAYLIETYTRPHDESVFPSKLRWIEKSVEIIIYSNQNKTINFSIDVTPGFAKTKDPLRHFVIQLDKNTYHYTIKAKSTLTIKQLKLHKGFNYLRLTNLDEASQPRRNMSIIHTAIPLDLRLLNFAISNIQVDSK